MQIIFIISSFIGIVLAFFGGKILLKIKNQKTISELDLTEKTNLVTFSKKGDYSLNIVGGGYVKNINNFSILINYNNNLIKVLERKPKKRFFYKGKLTTEFKQFEIRNIGEHKIEFENINDLEVKDSMLFSKRMFQKRKNTSEIGILIKETSPSLNYLLGLILVIFGLQIGFISLALFYLNN
ncbi:MAG: hypothetical protein ACI924_000994 [Flavobacterium sp.]|jgi:hypothetical protein